MKKTLTLLIETLIVLLLVSFAAFGAVRPPSPSDRDAIRLTWSYPDSEMPNIAKFRVYSGAASGVYDTFVDVPADVAKVAQFDVTGFVGVKFFVATAVDENGIESLPSTELVIVVSPRPGAPADFSGTRITILVD